MKPRTSLHNASLMTASLVAFITTQSASAANIWWDGGTANWSGGSSGLTGWSTVSNATTPDPTATPGASDDLFFNITTNNAANNVVSFANSNRAARSFTFNTSGTTNFRGGGASTVNINLTVGTGGITINENAGAVTIGQTPSSFGTINVILNGSQTWDNNGNSLTVTGNVSNGANLLTIGGSGNTTILGAIGSGSGGLVMNGAGNLILSGANTYTGTTTVSNGILRVNGTHTGGTAYTVAAADTLQGTGSTESVLNISGTLSPGAFVESFASGTVNLFNDSIFEYEVDSSVATGVGADLQVITGDLNLTGTVTLTLGDLASLPTAFALGTTFSLINYSGDWNGGLFTFGGDEIVNGGTFTAGLNTW